MLPFQFSPKSRYPAWNDHRALLVCFRIAHDNFEPILRNHVAEVGERPIVECKHNSLSDFRDGRSTFTDLELESSEDRRESFPSNFECIIETQLAAHDE